MTPLENLHEVLKSSALAKKIYYFRTIDSTNDFAKKTAFEGAGEGTLVIAEEQTRGRGRQGRRWVSPPGTGLWFSLVLRPGISPIEAAGITPIAAVSVAGAVEEATGLPARIKWPNDILIGGRKACGILTELGSEPGGSHYVVVGIGINVNTSSFPEEIKDTATSLKEALGREVSRTEVLARTIGEFEKFYFDFIETKSLARVLTAYRAKSATIGKRVGVAVKDGVLRAEAVDIAADGGLLIKKDDGELMKINSGEVTLGEVGLG